MWYDLARLLVCLCVFLGGLIIVWRKIRNKRKGTLLLSVLAIILWVVSSFIPVENLFFTFPSPTAAYQYSHMEAAKLTVAGENTDLVVGGDDTTITFAIIRKENDGWKIENKFNAETVYSSFNQGISVDIYRHKATGDCYVSVVMPYSATNSIKDSYNAKFYAYDFTSNSESASAFYSAYAFIGSLDTAYEININGIVFQIAAIENGTCA